MLWKGLRRCRRRRCRHIPIISARYYRHRLMFNIYMYMYAYICGCGYLFYIYYTKYLSQSSSNIYILGLP